MGSDSLVRSSCETAKDTLTVTPSPLLSDFFLELGFVGGQCDWVKRGGFQWQSKQFLALRCRQAWLLGVVFVFALGGFDGWQLSAQRIVTFESEAQFGTEFLIETPTFPSVSPFQYGSNVGVNSSGGILVDGGHVGQAAFLETAYYLGPPNDVSLSIMFQHKSPTILGTCAGTCSSHMVEIGLSSVPDIYLVDANFNKLALSVRLQPFVQNLNDIEYRLTLNSLVGRSGSGRLFSLPGELVDQNWYELSGVFREQGGTVFIDGALTDFGPDGLTEGAVLLSGTDEINNDPAPYLADPTLYGTFMVAESGGVNAIDNFTAVPEVGIGSWGWGSLAIAGVFLRRRLRCGSGARVSP